MSDTPEHDIRADLPPYEPTEAEQYAALPQLSQAELDALDESEPDPPEFRRDLVPDGIVGDLFFSGRTGRGLTDAEYDSLKATMREHDDWPLDHPEAGA